MGGAVHHHAVAVDRDHDSVRPLDDRLVARLRIQQRRRVTHPEDAWHMHVHNYIGHNFLGHEYIGRKYIRFTHPEDARHMHVQPPGYRRCSHARGHARSHAMRTCSFAFGVT